MDDICILADFLPIIGDCYMDNVLHGYNEQYQTTKGQYIPVIGGHGSANQITEIIICY